MKKIKRVISNLFWLNRPYWKYGKGYACLSLFFWVALLPACRVLMVIFPEQMVKALEAGWDWNRIVLLIVGFQAALLLIPVFENFYNNIFRDRAQASIELKVKKEVYHQALRTDYQYVDDPKYYNKYRWAIEHQVEKVNEAFSLINGALSALMIISALVTIISSFNPLIVVLTVLSMVVRTIGYMKYNQYEVKREEALVEKDRKLDYFHRVFYLRGYNADLKSTSLKNIILGKYDDEAVSKLEIIKKYGKNLVAWATFSDFIYRIAMTLIIVMIAYSILIGKIPEAATYITIMLSVEKLEDYMYEFFELFQKINKLSMYAEDIRGFYEIESRIEREELQAGKSGVSGGAFALDVDHVSFRYEHSQFAVKDLDLHIKPGEKVAIVGENGVGKSTLIKLLLCLYDVKGGAIRINQKPIQDYDIHQLRKRIGIVFQESNVYALSLLENLELYHDVKRENARKIIDSVKLTKAMDKNSATLDSVLTKEFDENGIMFSGGEVQKIGLARVMDGDFGLLLLDEPSSALDPISEYEMNQLILNQSRETTTIIIAHRLSTVRDLDRILVMKDGRIVESGSHEELMSQKGNYFEMFRKQAENYLK